jgi:cell pole-organizing protein PopZ
MSTAGNSRERLDEPATSSPIDIAKANAFDPDAEEEETERFATTPLLPPMLIKTRFDDQPTQSPLQSPSVADLSASVVATPTDTPPFRAYPTPPLSSKPSVASFKASRPGYMVPSSDIPPMMLTTPDDKWAAKLSHANFTISPEPYVPEVCDAASLRRLFSDWEQARCNFTKHLVRTGEHWGATSKIYRLTEQKWAEIDALWKTNNDLAISRAAAIGAEPEPSSPAEPAPLSKIPSLNDPKTPGKFPKLGDEDIVGPMVQIAAQIQKTPTRKRAFFKFFGDMKFPGSFFGPSRSNAGIRTR